MLWIAGIVDRAIDQRGGVVAHLHDEAALLGQVIELGAGWDYTHSNGGRYDGEWRDGNRSLK